jgi:phytoene dehydrogenase-like protein
MDADAIVVGSGLAGLTVAALLANAGRRVQVLEAHEHLGGYGHTFSFTNPYSDRPVTFVERSGPTDACMDPCPNASFTVWP